MPFKVFSYSVQYLTPITVQEKIRVFPLFTIITAEQEANCDGFFFFFHIFVFQQKLPNVVIEYTSIPRLTEGENVLNEFELPIDEIWEFPRSSVTLGKCLGEGEFGIVLKADASGIIERNIITTVAVKMLKSTTFNASFYSFSKNSKADYFTFRICIIGLYF